MKKKYFSLVIIVSFLLTISSASNLSKVQEIPISNVNEELLVSSKEINKNNIIALQEKYNNSDISAILTIDNSNFKEIVVQTIDNKYYLDHDYKKNYDKLGTVYADYRINLDSSSKNLIYGHSSRKRSAPFNYLENYYDESFYNNHKYITLETQNDIYKYEIFSVYVETSDFTYMNLNFDNDKDWYVHLLKLKKKSLYEIKIEITKDDDILILQTCSTNPKYKKYPNKYLLIVSRRVK